MMYYLAPLWFQSLKERFLGRTNGAVKPEVLAGEGEPSPLPDERQPEIAGTLEARTWLTAAASVAGSGHVKRRRGSDDWFQLKERGEMLYVVVTDGMGSVPFGGIGARVASRAAMESLLGDSGDSRKVCQLQGVVRQAVGAAQEAIQHLANWTGFEKREFATTIICAVVSKGSIAIGQVGDGALVVRTLDGQTTRLVSPQKGTYANETAALGLGEEVLVTRAIQASVDAIAVFSDGLERIALVKDDPYAPFLDPLWQFVCEAAEESDKELTAFLQSDRVQRATDDDCTLVLAKLAKVEDKL